MCIQCEERGRETDLFSMGGGCAAGKQHAEVNHPDREVERLPVAPACSRLTEDWSMLYITQKIPLLNQRFAEGSEGQHSKTSSPGQGSWAADTCLRVLVKWSLWWAVPQYLHILYVFLGFSKSGSCKVLALPVLLCLWCAGALLECVHELCKSIRWMGLQCLPGYHTLDCVQTVIRSSAFLLLNTFTRCPGRGLRLPAGSYQLSSIESVQFELPQRPDYSTSR